MFRKNKLLIEALKSTINSLEDELKKEKEKNEIYQKDLIIVLKNGEEQRKKIKDLENNVEFLYNNLSPKKKKLVRPEN